MMTKMIMGLNETLYFIFLEIIVLKLMLSQIWYFNFDEIQYFVQKSL